MATLRQLAGGIRLIGLLVGLLAACAPGPITDREPAGTADPIGGVASELVNGANRYVVTGPVREYVVFCGAAVEDDGEEGEWPTTYILVGTLPLGARQVGTCRAPGNKNGHGPDSFGGMSLAGVNPWADIPVSARNHYVPELPWQPYGIGLATSVDSFDVFAETIPEQVGDAALVPTVEHAENVGEAAITDAVRSVADEAWLGARATARLTVGSDEIVVVEAVWAEGIRAERTFAALRQYWSVGALRLEYVAERPVYVADSDPSGRGWRTHYFPSGDVVYRVYGDSAMASEILLQLPRLMLAD